MILYPHQADLDSQISNAYAAGHRNVLAVLACGGGKTAIFSNRVNNLGAPAVAIAHRRELVGQMSRTFGRYGIRHRIIGPKNVIKDTVQSHIIEFGRDFYDPTSPVAVAGVDTLASWAKEGSPHYYTLLRWAQQVRLWVTDEAHHIVGDGSGNGNKWGRAIALFPNALGLGVTATPERADGKGLGRVGDGPFDCMVEGPGMRWLINAGYLTDYRVFCPPSNLDLSTVGTGTDGDYIRGQLSLKTRSSTIMGHVVEHYQRVAPGRLGVTFAPDVETATMFSRLFNAAGVPAEVVSADTPDKTRVEVMKRFARRQVLQLVNVDLFGEGFDLPAIEVVSMARATKSYGLYVQQFGRGCRILEGKDRAIIIDHVGNVVQHGLPDRPRQWSLYGRDKRPTAKLVGDIPLRVCLQCTAPYEAVLLACPYCGWVPVPTMRSAPELVDGDLFELDEDTLARMRGEINRVDRHPSEVERALLRGGKPLPVARGAANQHEARQRAQNELRAVMEWFGGVQTSLGYGVRSAQRAFYHMFGIDVLSAQALGRPEAEQLTERVRGWLIERGVGV